MFDESTNYLVIAERDSRMKRYLVKGFETQEEAEAFADHLAKHEPKDKIAVFVCVPHTR